MDKRARLQPCLDPKSPPTAASFAKSGRLAKDATTGASCESLETFSNWKYMTEAAGLSRFSPPARWRRSSRCPAPISDSEMDANADVLPIPATVRSNDGARYARFDARAWFLTATPAQVLALAAERWRGIGSALDVARSAAATNDEVADVLQYVMYLRHGGQRASCVVQVDETAALEWLAYRRPKVLSALRACDRVA
jgi:hypothetical protein